MWVGEDEATLWCRGGIQVIRYRYYAERYPWGPIFVPEENAVGLVCYGAFRRRSDGIEQFVDANTGFFRRFGEEVSAANFTGTPEQLTLVDLDDDVLVSLLGEPGLPTGPFYVTPAIDVAHRLLLRAIGRGGDALDIETRAVHLVAAAIGQRRGDMIRGTRATTESNRRTLVSDAQEMLHDSGRDISLQELARAVGCSPFHLSRVFRDGTGCTISQYRLRLRVHEVLDRLEAGEDDLAALAVAVGFADHSHMTRTVVAQLGEAPSALRRRLRAEQ
jgi:AraC-like DNA-binding protein